MNSFNCELLINAPRSRIYQALTTAAGLQAWWTEDCAIEQDIGARSTFNFGETFKIMRIAGLTTDAEVRWTCTNSHITAPGLKRPDEWIGTEIVFRLTPHGAANENTLLQFEHIGLSPALECYALCSSAWHQFLGSLKQYVETGTGQPYMNTLSQTP
jgi:uncharacterized protein YndB with AHSA1/START domain